MFNTFSTDLSVAPQLVFILTVQLAATLIFPCQPHVNICLAITWISAAFISLLKSICISLDNFTFYFQLILSSQEHNNSFCTHLDFSRISFGEICPLLSCVYVISSGMLAKKNALGSVALFLLRVLLLEFGNQSEM